MNESTLYICLGILTLAFAAAVFIVLLLVPHYDKMRREWMLAKLAAREAREASEKQLSIYELKLKEAENIIRAISKKESGKKLTLKDEGLLAKYEKIKEAAEGYGYYLLLYEVREKSNK